MRCFVASIVAIIFLASNVVAQILVSSGDYTQNFNSLASSNTGWTNNVTLPGWYASKNGEDSTNALAGAGSSNTGGLYSFGVAGANPVSDRALGSLASGSASPVAFGISFTNDTLLFVTNILVSFTGEQWRNGGSGSASTLAFSCAVSSSPITNAQAAVAWTSFAALDFITPTVNASSGSLDGNNTANRQFFSNVSLAGVTVEPGQKLFLRWLDVNDSGSDSALAIDDLTVSFEAGTNSPPADTNPPPTVIITNGSITLMTYNVKGNGAADWSTNAEQVQAIGRELLYLQPDVITFNEIPYADTWQMTNWVTSFMPGYSLAMNSGTDGSIRSVIASRFPINRSKNWLTHADLDPFGYTNANFTRDLFEAEVAVPGWPQPLHVFTTHLKSSNTGYADAAAKRAAEAAAITNFFATNLFTQYPPPPFTLSGDLNESDTNATAIQELINAPTTLRLTNPANPFSGSINSYSIQGSLSERIDFIFPCTLLFSNIVSSQIFRSDLLTNLPPNLYSSDDKTASDHLPVLMTFANPFTQPYVITSLSQTNGNVTVQWQSVPGQSYQLESSTDLAAWTALATNLTATNYSYTVKINLVGGQLYFRVKRVD